MAISYRCSVCGKKAKQGTNELGGEGALHCPKHPRAVIDSVVGPGRPKGSGQKLAQAVVLVSGPAVLLAAAEHEATKEGVSVREWWRRAARVRLGWREIAEQVD